MVPLEDDEYGVRAAAEKMAKCLTELGQVGPCNFQSRITAEGPFFYEINPRFSGGSGMRAALGFNEVEACLRHLVLNQSAQEVRSCLATRYDQICGMHPAEMVMDMPLIEQLNRDLVVDVALAHCASKDS